MKTAISQQLVAGMLKAIQHVHKRETVTYDDVWEATAVLAATTLISTPQIAHEEAIKDLLARMHDVLVEFHLDHPRKTAP